MIDEFQDTSAVQWSNFKILLNECMSHSQSDRQLTSNLIVGDVKQSIYRWRGGDWRLLNNIQSQFSHPDSSLEIKTLQANYRSERNIVDFNNCFFKAAAETEYGQETEAGGEQHAKELLSAYSDVYQQPNGDRGGFVKITLLPDDDYEQDTLENTAQAIRELLAHGAKPSDIAIILRKNSHIQLIADYLGETMPGLDIVSDEAFRLDASPAVNIVIQALMLLASPEDTLAKANLAINYQRTVLGSNHGHGDLLTPTADTKSNLDTLLPADFINNTDKLSKMPLAETIDSICSAFNLEQLNDQGAYLCAFYDKVSDFVANNPGNIGKFIEAWNDDICSSTIQSDAVSGLRLISIHKSKGLEFAHVIIPFCSWTLENGDTTLWCKPDGQPFDSLPVIPVDYSKKLLDTIYADDYRNEHIQNSVDNLNLLYVAFTRAGRSLHVTGSKGKKKEGRPTARNCWQNACPSLRKRLRGQGSTATKKTVSRLSSNTGRFKAIMRKAKPPASSPRKTYSSCRQNSTKLQC